MEVMTKNENGRAALNVMTLSLNDPCCLRCGGLMVLEHCLDLFDDTGKLFFVAHRCIQCGDILDPIILRNRHHRQERITTRTKVGDQSVSKANV